MMKDQRNTEKALSFKSWKRSVLFEWTRQTDGRLAGKLPLTLQDTETGQQVQGEAPFLLMAAGDVRGIKEEVIKQKAPAPGAPDAETTKLVHMDFWDPALPWRYTPQVNAVNLRPWMVLLVGTEEEIQVEGGIATVKDSVLLAHNLAESFLWAHTQHDGHQEIARLISPRGLEINEQGQRAGLLGQHAYRAVLVPAFNENGEEMWTITEGRVQLHFGKKGFLPAFHTWSFMTAETGDFATFAAALRLTPAGDVGKAKLRYRRNIPADGVAVDQTLEIRGAITSLQEEGNQKDALEKVKADLDTLNDALENTVGLPAYGHPWVPDPDSIPNGWPSDLNDDPRYRGIAGLGVWMGVEAQESLMDAATSQAGALREAGLHIGNLAQGLMAAGSLWSRHLPTGKKDRLRILGPLMARLPAEGGGMVMDRISAAGPLSAALFSSVSHRLLRNRSHITRQLTGTPGTSLHNQVLSAVNQPAVAPGQAPEGLPHLAVIVREMNLQPLEDLLRLDMPALTDLRQEISDLTGQFALDFRRRRSELVQAGADADISALRTKMAKSLTQKVAELLQGWLQQRELPCEGAALLENVGKGWPGGAVELFSHALEEDTSRNRLLQVIWDAVCDCMALRPCREQTVHADVSNRQTLCDDLIHTIAPEPKPDPFTINLEGLSDLLFLTLDPRTPDAPVIRRVCSRLHGIDCTKRVRPEFPIGLDFPAWNLLRQFDKEWLLPGVSSLEKDSITALQTNPAFIDAFMVGLNTQFLSEMRWRDLAAERNCTPLRMFWGQVRYATGQRQADIEPLAEWAKTPSDPVGALAHQSLQPDDAGNTTGSRLVIVFRSDLFKRYPSTLVYLVKNAEGDDVDALLKQVPELDRKDEDRPGRKFFGPIFSARLAADLTFFSFDVTPSELDQYWLVLDEPPSESRFCNNNDLKHPSTGAVFATVALNMPTRVAISGADLKKQGLSHEQLPLPRQEKAKAV